MNQNVPKNQGERGLSMVELLIAVVAAAIILVLANGIFVNFQKESVGQRRLAQGQSELHAAKYSLEKNLRRVGSNIPRVSRIRLSATSFPTRQAIYIGNNLTGPDTLVVRGNFDTATSQLRSPLNSSLNTDILTLLTGTATRFAVKDYVVLQSSEWNEYTQITSINLAAGTICTQTRLNPYYPVGTSITRVSSYTYFVASDSSLQVTGPFGTAKLLDDHVKDLSFALQSYGKNSFVTTSSTTDSAVDTAEYVKYAFIVRIKTKRPIPRPDGFWSNLLEELNMQPLINTLRRDQRGSMLLVVLGVGFVVLLLSAATLLSVRNSSKMAGIQRVEFQDIHSAEAGVVRVQQRFNQASTLCSGFFSKADSTAVAAAMVTSVFTLPTPYGTTRAVRVSNFKLELGKPMRVSFVSTGGRWIGGKFDTSQGKHTLKAVVRMTTLADFSSFSETGDQVYGGNVNQIGKVHAGHDMVLVGSNTTFRDEVSYANAIRFTVDPTTVSFRKGHKKVSANPFSLNRIYINDNTGSTCGAKTYKDLAQGLATGEGTGFAYLGGASIFLSLDSIKINAKNGKVEMPYFAADTSKRPPKGLFIGRWSQSPTQFNGVIYSSQSIFLEDTLRNFSLTIASAIDIYGTGNTRCIGSEVQNANNRVTLGLLPTNNFHFWEKSPSSITVEAQVVAPQGGWGADGDSLTHIGRDTLGKACDIHVASCWYLRLLGGDITKNSGGAGCWAGYGGKRHYDFDPDMLFSPPPKFPVLYGLNGAVPVWGVAAMGDRN